MLARLRLFAAFLILIPSLRSVAQEWNIGVHLNPTLCFPISTSQTQRDPELRLSAVDVGYSYGVSTSFSSGRISVETGLSFTQKKYAIRQSEFRTLTQTGITAKSSFAGLSTEVPVLVKYRIKEHAGRSNYSANVLLGVGYEWFNPQVVPTDRLRDETASGAYRVSILSIPLPDAADFSWPTAIAGAEIRAVLRGIGLLEYGVALHIPLQSTGPYGVETTVEESGQPTRTFEGEFYPRLAHLDFRIRYCLLNFKKGEGRVRYRG